MKKSPRKLRLHKETLRTLTENRASLVKGGLSQVPTCPPTLQSECYCPSDTDCTQCQSCLGRTCPL